MVTNPILFLMFEGIFLTSELEIFCIGTPYQVKGIHLQSSFSMIFLLWQLIFILSFYIYSDNNIVSSLNLLMNQMVNFYLSSYFTSQPPRCSFPLFDALFSFGFQDFPSLPGVLLIPLQVPCQFFFFFVISVCLKVSQGSVLGLLSFTNTIFLMISMFLRLHLRIYIS